MKGCRGIDRIERGMVIGELEMMQEWVWNDLITGLALLDFVRCG
jgi:hypothetical protein